MLLKTLGSIVLILLLAASGCERAERNGRIESAGPRALATAHSLPATTTIRTSGSNTRANGGPTISFPSPRASP